MGGLSPEYLQKLQQGIGGMGQGMMLGQQMKQRKLERKQDYFQQQSQYKDLKPGVETPPELQQYSDISAMFEKRKSLTAGSPIGEERAKAYGNLGLPGITPDMTLADVESIRKFHTSAQSAGLRKKGQEIQIGGQQIDIAKFTFDDIQLEKQKDLNEAKVRNPGEVQIKLEQNKMLDDIIKFKRFPGKDWITIFKGKKRDEIVQTIQDNFPQATPLYIKYFVNQIMKNKRQYGIK